MHLLPPSMDSAPSSDPGSARLILKLVLQELWQFSAVQVCSCILLSTKMNENRDSSASPRRRDLNVKLVEAMIFGSAFGS